MGGSGVGITLPPLPLYTEIITSKSISLSQHIFLLWPLGDTFVFMFAISYMANIYKENSKIHVMAIPLLLSGNKLWDNKKENKICFISFSLLLGDYYLLYT